MTNCDACRIVGKMLNELMILLDDFVGVRLLLSIECAFLEL